MNIIAKLTNPPPTPASGGHYAEASSVIATQSRMLGRRLPQRISKERSRPFLTCLLLAASISSLI